MIIWVVFLIQLGVVAAVLKTARVDDMTLARGKVQPFNTGWVLLREDGTETKLQELPYYTTSLPEEKIVIENTIPGEFRGETLIFLSADKTLRITVDGEEIYTFGLEDQRLFGHTPGSVIVFADIPAECKAGKIQIEMVSPYADYATYFTEMAVAKRDVAILHFLKQKAVDAALSVIILIVAVSLLVLAIVQKMSHRKIGGVEYLGIYLLLMSIYYLIETKILEIFYGNQTLYSNLIFLILMTAPLFLEAYCYESMPAIAGMISTVMLVSVINVAAQLVLQISGAVDFMDMSFVSHGIIVVLVLISIVTLGKSVTREKKLETVLHLAGVSCMLIGVSIDILRTYSIKVGDLGKASRYGVCIFAVCTLIIYMRQMMQEHVRFVEQARNDAIAANVAKSRFLASMSHEIRTPLNGILGMDAILIEECGDDDLKEYARNIQSAGQSLLSIINDVLDISRIEEGRLELLPVEYELFSVINDCCNIARVRAESKALTFCMKIEPELPACLYGDEVRIKQIINNLLSNAVKYTEEGTVTLSISHENQPEHQIMLVIEVQDTGIGIREEDMDKLFQSFTRLEEERNRNTEGTGLGLNLTGRLVELMGGEIYARSVYGKGSCFTVRIPQRVRKDAPIGDFEKRYREFLNTTEHYRQVFTAPDAQLLVVDDVDMNLKVIKGLLKKTGIRVDTAESGRAALEYVKNRSYDIIFLDHMMPEMDGLETLHQMRLSGSLREETPVIMLTANAIRGAREEYLQAGFADYLTKPVREEKLYAILEKYLEGKLVYEKDAGNGMPEEERSGKELLKRLEEIPGLDTQTGLEYCMEEEFYEEMLRDYAGSGKAEVLTQSFEKRDWKQYRITVHALKSTSRMIGALSLSEQAEELEKAAAAGEEGFILSQHQELLEKYTDLLDRLHTLLG